MLPRIYKTLNAGKADHWSCVVAMYSFIQIKLGKRRSLHYGMTEKYCHDSGQDDKLPHLQCAALQIQI